MSDGEKGDILQRYRAMAGEPGGADRLEVFRVDQQVREFITFTTQTEDVRLHYVEDPDVNSYVHCNAAAGPDGAAGCLLCLIENKLEERMLLPVYDPRAGAVAVLAVSSSCRPNALLPQ